ncbi:multidrug resistance protein MdtN [Citrobacter koseri]|uniref:Multidrug resistance protein MdtN n=1 Tax=Citrobacter koseri TaxID=545 RepID=A0A2X2YPP1_CITKO|nr:multidrug resistance protein MdtN [Citrobacter koseri]
MALPASNGRIEATEVDIATKIAGRIDTILVSEGQFVRQGEVLAKMDTRVLQEQRLEAIAQIKEAESAVCRRARPAGATPERNARRPVGGEAA